MNVTPTTTYVRAVEAKENADGKVVWVLVHLATGHTFTCHPDEAPKAGAYLEVLVREPHPALSNTELRSVR